MNTKVILGAILVLCIGVIGYAYMTLPASPTTTSNTIPAASSDTGIQSPTAETATTSTQTNTTGTTQAPPNYTLATVAQHNSASSCWTAINGNVYDLTNWINQHPGGPGAILSICGKDGSAAFNDQHGGQRRPANELAGFLLAPLSQ